MRTCTLTLCLAAIAAAQTAPPKTRTGNVAGVLHGVKIADPYRWLEDQNSPETRAWIDEQNKFTESLLDPVPIRGAIEKRVGELMRVDITGMPVARGGRLFFTKRRADQDQNVIYVRDGVKGADRVLIDPHPLSPNHNISVNILDVTNDGRTLAYGLRNGGQDEVEVHYIAVDSGREIDRLPRARYGSVELADDLETIYYSRRDPSGYRVYRRRLGAAPASDTLIFGQGYGPEKGVGARLSRNGRWLMLSVFHGWSRSDLWIQDLARRGAPKPLMKDLDGRHSPEFAGDTLYVHTTWKAPNGRVLAIDLKDAAPERWREIIPESKTPIEDMTLAGGKIVVHSLEDVKSRLRVFDAAGKPLHDIGLPSLGSVGGVLGRWEDPDAYFSFQSFATPLTIFRYSMPHDTREVWARRNVPVDPAAYDVKQSWYRSRDGTRVPMFIAHKKGLAPDGNRPTLLTGYGGFAVSVKPGFSAELTTWMDLGGVVAVPNLRGGNEYGEAWHKAGMRDNKQHVFDDFIAAAEHLIESGYTKPSRLAIMGRSNGGLLVGAAMTQRPDLFGAVVCGYPLLDMLRYHKFLLGALWISEYGSADESPEQFKTLYAYSPYHHVKKGTNYPAVLFVTGDSDTRVAPLHARKMAALLQASTASGKPVLLRYDTQAGHSAGVPLKKQIEDDTAELTFLAWQLGIEK